MNEDKNLSGPDNEDDIAAAEYVLGVLPLDERGRVAARIDASRRFSDLVEAWKERLAPLDEHYELVEPPAHLERTIMERVFGPTVESADAGWWNSLSLWRSLALVSTGLAAAMLVFFVVAPQPERIEPDRELMAASLAIEGSDQPILAVYDGGTGELSLTSIREKQPDEDYELWVIPATGGDPLSLGIVPDPREARVRIDPDMQPHFAEGATIAISLEPKGGSPTGKATGPVIAAGPARAF